MARLGRAPNNRTNVWTTVVWTTLEERRFSAVIPLSPKPLSLRPTPERQRRRVEKPAVPPAPPPRRPRLQFLSPRRFWVAQLFQRCDKSSPRCQPPAAKRQKNAAHSLP